MFYDIRKEWKLLRRFLAPIFLFLLEKNSVASLSRFWYRFFAFLGRKTDKTTIQEAGLQAVENPNAVDDRDGFFVEVLALLCRLPQDTDFAKKANEKAITLLYNSLPHPPAAYIGQDPSGSVPWTLANADGSKAPSSWSATNGAAAQASSSSSTPPSWGAAPPAPPRTPWAFRMADGSGNNTWLPSLGQSARPYARDVQGSQPLPANKLPDAGDVFDALMRMTGEVSLSYGTSKLFLSFLKNDHSSSRTLEVTLR